MYRQEKLSKPFIIGKSCLKKISECLRVISSRWDSYEQSVFDS